MQGLKVALFSGGKDSVYSALLEWPVDLFLTVVYEFPRPSPHLINIRKLLELSEAMSVPLIVARVHKGHEFEEEVGLLRKLGTETLVAGDQGVEDHLKYMGRLAAEAGASLREPIWGANESELLLKEAEELSFTVIGSERKEIMCKHVSRENVMDFLSLSRSLNISPIGEAGEYHSLVYEVKRLGARIGFRCSRVRSFNGYFIANVV